MPSFMFKWHIVSLEVCVFLLLLLFVTIAQQLSRYPMDNGHIPVWKYTWIQTQQFHGGPDQDSFAVSLLSFTLMVKIE